MTPEEKAYVAALENIVATSTLLLNRLAAMEQSGVLSPIAKESVEGWVDRVVLSIKALPKKPEPEEE